MDESKEFFFESFIKVGIEIKDMALDVLSSYSSGVPTLLHELGEATFILNNDEVVEFEDAINGIIGASYNVGQRYIGDRIIKELKSNAYRNILRVLSEKKIGYKFNRKQLFDMFSQTELQKEKSSIDNFIRRMKKINFIIEGDSRGEYRFLNRLYHGYLVLHAFRETQEQN